MLVRVLGPLEVSQDGVPRPIGARLQRAVLTVLVLARGQVVPADRLADLLWGDSPPPKVTSSLHTTVAHLRRALEPDRAPRSPSSVVVTAPPGYRVPREAVDVDADRFERLLAEARPLLGSDDARAAGLLEQALDLWRGPALAEFAEEAFARTDAERLETLRLGAVEQYATALLHLGDLPRAVATLQAHVAAHPMREQARAQLARALYLDGRQGQALSVLQEGRRLLRDELGLDPGPELRRLEQQILDQDPALRPVAPRAVTPAGPAVPTTTAPAVHLAGRGAELAALEAWVAAAAAGTGGVVLVTGDAGIGKTAILGALRRMVLARAGVVREVTCRGGRSAPPFWPALQLIRNAAADADAPGRARLIASLGPLRGLLPARGDAAVAEPATGGVDPAMVLVHLGDALAAALSRDGAERPGPPALLAVDDLHLADAATLRLLGGVAARAADEPTVVALALRSGEGGDDPALVDLLATVGRLPRVLRLDLRALPEEAVLGLVTAEAPPGLSPDDLAAIVRRAEGNPFFALEIARAAGAPRTPGADRAGVPPAVSDVLRSRVLRLPDPGPDLLAAAAVANRPVTAEDLAAVTGSPLDAALDALEAAEQSRLVVGTGGGGIVLAHALLADALRAGLPGTRSARLHRALAERLAERCGDDPEQASRIAAHHLAARAIDGGAAAVPWLERAADHALTVSALEPLRDAAEQLLSVLPGSGGPDRVRTELRARSRLAYVDAWDRGYDSPAIREYCRSVNAWQLPRPARPDDAELLWTATLLHCQVGRLDDADRTVTRMATVAAEVGDPTADYLTADMTAVVRWMQGRPAEALEQVDRAEAAVATGGVDLRRSLAFSPPTRIAVLRGLALWSLGRGEEASAAMSAALRVAEAAGLGAAGFARRWALVLALLDRDAERVRALVARRMEDPGWERLRYPAAVVRFAEGWLRARDGDPGQGLADMRAAHAALVEQSLTAGRSVFLGLLAEVALTAGDPAQALAFCDAAWAVAERGERFGLAALERVRASAAAAPR